MGLQGIGRLDLLRDLFDEVFVPPEVSTVGLTFPAGFGPGERGAILPALELRPHATILDDGAARSFARGLGLAVTGLVGLLVLGKNNGVLKLVRPEVDALMNRGFRISMKLYRDALALAGER